MTYADERARAQAEAHERLIARIFRAERRIRRPDGPKRARKPPEKPKHADDVLAKLATRFQPGHPLSVGEIARATGCSAGIAFAVRLWAKGRGIWPYKEAIAKGARP
jgi:hypothetical protein